MEKGRRILIDAYWSGKTGWKDGTVSEEDRRIALEEGYMFEDPLRETHEEALKRLEAVLAQTDPQKVGKAFLYSLSSRRLEYRSALGSYYYAKAVPPHLSTTERYGCRICGWTPCPEAGEERARYSHPNVLNFERIKWGGVRHTDLGYALFDLEQFIKLPEAEPQKEDVEILKKILDCVSLLTPRQGAGGLRDAIIRQKIFKTNRAEVGTLLNVLGICGILSGRDHPCYEERFVNEYDRAPLWAKNDFSYPVSRWHAEDGICWSRVQKVFPPVIAAALAGCSPQSE